MRPSLPARAMLACISFYRSHISPGLPPSCRFTPSCSEYAQQSISAHGALKGGYLAVRRILRCNPLHRGGYDPVPEKWSFRYKKEDHP